MSSLGEVQPSPLTDSLPIFQRRDFDILLNKSWPVGVDSTYPSELRKRLSAASVSLQMGNKSIDYVMKRYFKEIEYETTSPDRLDRKIESFLKESLNVLDKQLDAQGTPNQSVLGEMVAKWTFMRIPFSFGFAISCAQRGALFECLAIVRMILEQISWALEIQPLDDFNSIVSKTSNQSIRSLKSIHPSSGRFYNWLSEHAHWSYDSHINAFGYTNKTIAMTLANSLYKAQALSAVLLLFEISRKAYVYLIAVFSRLEADKNIDLDAFEGASALLFEVHSLVPNDNDVSLLLKMIEAR